LLGQYFQNSGLTHSKTLMAMTESLLKNLGLQISDIGLAAVASGPGSFTGVRIGVSAVKGLAWGANIPVCGVSTLSAMAYQLQEFDGIICPVMDARRNQVYNAIFEWQDGSPKRICDDRAISLEELSSELRSCKKSITLIGDGTDLTAEYLRGVNLEFNTAPVLLRNQTAYGVALAAAASKPVSALELEPSYLRPSQAERESGMTKL
jgi:tRNA threonylcarbamoyladenosine biosynthesis protein TsaB